MQLPNVFGVVIKALRMKRNMTQDELGAKCLLERHYISRLENGKSQPTLTSLFDIAKGLEMKPSELVRLVEMEFENQNRQ